MKGKTMPVWKERQEVNYWDCVSQRLFELYLDSGLTGPDWAIRRKNEMWEMHKFLCIHVQIIKGEI